MSAPSAQFWTDCSAISGVEYLMMSVGIVSDEHSVSETALVGNRLWTLVIAAGSEAVS